MTRVEANPGERTDQLETAPLSPMLRGILVNSLITQLQLRLTEMVYQDLETSLRFTEMRAEYIWDRLKQARFDAEMLTEENQLLRARINLLIFTNSCLENFLNPLLDKQLPLQ